jgi:hypothetical protein
MSEFLLPGPAPLLYLEARDGDSDAARWARALLEDLWDTFAPFAPRGFREAAQEDLHAFFWEMYLGACLLRQPVKLVPQDHRDARAIGPDLVADVEGTPVWFEATAPERGKGADAVPPLTPRELADVPESEIMLRYTSAVLRKRDKREGYVVSRTIAPSDPYIVAVNAGQFADTIIETELPSIMRAVFGMGPLGPVQLPDGRTVFSFDDPLRKASGEHIPTRMFGDPHFAGVSAVVWSPVNLFNHAGTYGREMIWVYNHAATNPVDPKTFRLGRAYWLEGGRGLAREMW